MHVYNYYVWAKDRRIFHPPKDRMYITICIQNEELKMRGLQ